LAQILAASAAATLAASQWCIWVYAPVERSMGIVQKIFYFHLPLAWWGFVAFFLVFAASCAYLWQKREKFDIVAQAAAELGVLFTTLVLVTGVLWARASWNTWWTWDPRLSTALVLWFIYAGYLVLREADLGGEKRRTLCAVLGIVGFLDVPLVFLSARFMRSIHPAVFASREGGLPLEMWIAVFVSLAAWGLLFGALLLVRFEQLRNVSRIDALIAWLAR
jgi:heme exporter protein C